MDDSLYLVTVVSTIVFLLLAVFIVVFLLLFQRQQLENLREKTAIKVAFEQEILQAQIEVQNQTLQEVGRDLHDNIGQLLSLIKLHLGALDIPDTAPDVSNHLPEAIAIVDLTIQEVRSLTKSLDLEFVEQFGLVNSLRHELDRLTRSGHFQTQLVLEGDVYPLGFKREIVLFRMVQEVINNVIKHADANHLHIRIRYEATRLTLIAMDNGIGFDQAAIQNRDEGSSGSGMRTLQRRARLIGGTCQIDSSPGRGTSVSFTFIL